jgi:hypothetical protein
MLPAVWPGDLLSVRSDNVTEALPGDIVLFAREGRLIAHRVVEKNLCPDGIQWVTRGDTVGINDAPVSSGELLGRVTAIERGSRRLNPRLTFWRQIGASILSRSEFCTRLLLWLRKSLPKEPGHGIRTTGPGICDL